jgi:hypothetical protein
MGGGGIIDVVVVDLLRWWIVNLSMWWVHQHGGCQHAVDMVGVNMVGLSTCCRRGWSIGMVGIDTLSTWWWVVNLSMWWMVDQLMWWMVVDLST